MTRGKPAGRDGARYPWPRFMRAETAAAYLDLSKTHFLHRIAPELPQVRLSAKVVGWLRDDLDAWIEKAAGRVPADLECFPNPWDS